MQALEDLGIAENTILVFLADNGAARNLANQWIEGKTVHGGKGTMT